jgi:tetratricopeptide (TPR) repeat protein
MRGKAQTLMGDIGAARGTYEQWARLAPASAPARFFLSDSLAMGGDAVRARAELERALQLDAQYLPARVGEIKMLVQFGELQQAGKALDKLRQDFGERNEVLGIEGWFALGTGDFQTAERRFATMLEQEPNLEIMTLHSRALWSQGKHDEALRLMQDWLKSNPDDTAVLLQVGEAYAALGRGADARSSYEAVIKRHPDHVPALNNLAWLNRERDPVQAMELARRAHRLSPENPQVLDTLGMLLAQRGDVTGAYRFVREAAERAPADPQIQLHLGDILVQQKRSEDARKVLEELVRQEPDSETGKAAKTLLETVRGTP